MEHLVGLGHAARIVLSTSADRRKLKAKCEIDKTPGEVAGVPLQKKAGVVTMLEELIDQCVTNDHGHTHSTGRHRIDIFIGAKPAAAQGTEKQEEKQSEEKIGEAVMADTTAALDVAMAATAEAVRMLGELPAPWSGTGRTHALRPVRTTMFGKRRAGWRNQPKDDEEESDVEDDESDSSNNDAAAAAAMLDDGIGPDGESKRTMNTSTWRQELARNLQAAALANDSSDSSDSSTASTAAGQLASGFTTATNVGRKLMKAGQEQLLGLTSGTARPAGEDDGEYHKQGARDSQGTRDSLVQLASAGKLIDR